MASNVHEETWDFIIVGGGSAGCVLANRLSANPDTRVLLLEAGGSDRSLFIAVPVLVLQAITKYNWKYLAEPDESRNGLRDIWHGGKVLGGGSSISGMIYVRGHRYDYDHWSELGCDGWDYESLLPHFKQIETYEQGPSHYRGGDGPLRSSNIRLISSIALIRCRQRCLYRCPLRCLAEKSSEEGLIFSGQSRMIEGRPHIDDNEPLARPADFPF